MYLPSIFHIISNVEIESEHLEGLITSQLKELIKENKMQEKIKQIIVKSYLYRKILIIIIIKVI